jgi:ribosomal protein S27AE
MKAQQRQCLNCGMAVAIAPLHLDEIPPRRICIKCDDDVYQQSKGTCLTQDIAHQHETITKALQKLDAVLLSAWSGYYREIRVIVGGGQIRQQVLGQLHYYQQQRKILSYQEESPNQGALLAVIRLT